MRATFPAAHVHGASSWGARLRAARRWRRESAGGRIATWSLSLGAAQAALVCASAGSLDRPALAVALAGVCALVATMVACTAWLLRLAIPFAPRAIGAVTTTFFYAAAGLAAARADGVIAASLIAPAAVWGLLLPAGRFVVPNRAQSA